jgi:hypothetical protein
MALARQCSTEKCPRVSIVALDGVPFCAEHFVSAAYRFLDEAALQLRHTPEYGPATAELARRLDDCTRGATSLALSSARTDNLVRARLIDILLWASELLKQVRRGPRTDVAIPVALAGSTDGIEWEEKTETQSVSQFGASMRCRRPLPQGAIVKVTRLDSGQQTSARVAWTSRKDTGNFETGIELLGDDDIWGISWDRPALPRGGARSSAEAN